METQGTRRKHLWVAMPVAAVLAVLIVVGVLAYLAPDIAPDRFDVGAAPAANGAVVLHIGDCLGGQVQRVSVAIDATDGTEPPGTELWVVEPEQGNDLSISPGEVIEVQVGTVLPGMVETVALRDELPAGQRLQVDVDTSLQSFGFFFRLDDLEEGKVWAGGHGLVTPDRFRSLINDLCD